MGKFCAQSKGGIMAVKKAKEIELVIPTGEEEGEESFIRVDEVKENPVVRVVPQRDFKCTIAGEWLVFYKDKPQNVSPFVESILRKDPTKLYR
jgi:hypothetical protein